MDKTAQDVVGWLAGPLLGFLASVTLFRGRFVAIEKDIEAMRKANDVERAHDRELFAQTIRAITEQIARECVTTEAFQKRMERRQKVSLEIIASIAHKNGVSHRALGTDALVELLSQGEGET